MKYTKLFSNYQSSQVHIKVFFLFPCVENYQYLNGDLINIPSFVRY